MAKKPRKEKSERVTRKQKKSLQKSSFNDDPEDLDSQLGRMGLCTKNIAGDGNCLFRSLSDQYYGQDGNHKAIRQEVCQFLRENKELYQFFVEDDQPFDHHVDCMSRNGTYGGNMELAAFAKMQEVDIKVYQPGLIYIIHEKEEVENDDDTQVLHIAYHSWEHYSSVRNIDGPHTGAPEIHIKTVEDDSIQEGEEELTSQEKVVSNACPNANIQTIKRFLKKHKGNPDDAINAIYESEFNQDDLQTETVEVEQEKVVPLDNQHEHDKNDSRESLDIKDGIQQKCILDAGKAIKNNLDVLKDDPKENNQQKSESKEEYEGQKEDVDTEKDDHKGDLHTDANTQHQEDSNTVTDATPQQEDDQHKQKKGDQLKNNAYSQEEPLNMHESDLLDQYPNIPLEAIRQAWAKHGNDVDASIALQNYQAEVSTQPEAKKCKEKKPSARERKELAKKKQKENQVLKQRAKAARKSKYKEEKEETTQPTSANKSVTAMKEIDI